jgi:hypothetical protein
MQSLPPPVQSALTLLNNINDLIVISSNRSDARKAMEALVLYAQDKKINIPNDKVENFFEVLIDSRPYTLTNILIDISEEIMRQNRK